MWHHMYGYGYGLNNIWPWLIGFGLIKIFVVVGIVVVFIKFMNKDRVVNQYQKSRAMQILQERYASGEIGEEEYKHKKKILSS